MIFESRNLNVGTQLTPSHTHLPTTLSNPLRLEATVSYKQNRILARQGTKGGGKIYGVPGPGPEAGGQGLFLGKNMTG